MLKHDDYITIRCQEKGSATFFTISLDYDERLDGGKVTMVVRSTKHTDVYQIKHFFNFISEKLDSYVSDRQLKYNYLRFNFSLKDTDDVIRLLEKYYHYITAKKYNI